MTDWMMGVRRGRICANRSKPRAAKSKICGSNWDANDDHADEKSMMPRTICSCDSVNASHAAFSRFSAASRWESVTANVTCSCAVRILFNPSATGPNTDTATAPNPATPTPAATAPPAIAPNPAVATRNAGARMGARPATRRTVRSRFREVSTSAFPSFASCACAAAVSTSTSAVIFRPSMRDAASLTAVRPASAAAVSASTLTVASLRDDSSACSALICA